MKSLIPQETIDQRIFLIRGERVILDCDLAQLYGVSTKRLNEQVRRNAARFPGDFVFRLSVRDAESLRSQIATSKTGRGGRRYLPYAFTEHGAIMAANVLNSERAVKMSVFVVRAFIKLRKYLSDNKVLAHKLAELEKKLTDRLDDHEEIILNIIAEIKKLMAPPSESPKRRIGFHL